MLRIYQGPPPSTSLPITTGNALASTFRSNSRRTGQYGTPPRRPLRTFEGELGVYYGTNQRAAVIGPIYSGK